MRIHLRSTPTVALLALLAIGLVGAEEGSPAPHPDPVLEEHVQVVLVDLVVRVVDRKGRALVDLKPEEVQISEGGQERQLAYFAPLASQGAGRELDHAEQAAALYDSEGAPTSAAPEVVVRPPAVQRRIVLAFDPANSRQRVREKWKAAAIEWAIDSMRPDDRVAIVTFHTGVDWVLEPTTDRERVMAALGALDLDSHAPDRDRRSEMTALVDELFLCSDAYRTQGVGRSKSSDATGPFATNDAVDCGYRIVEPFAAQWDIEASERVLGLRTLVGQLAAIDGPKEVLLFSEGVVPDAANLLATTMVGVFGADAMRIQEISTRLARNSLEELTRLFRGARSAGVVFHAFDTRSGADRGHYDAREYAPARDRQTLGINPVAEMYNETNGMLSSLAHETGGRAYHGTSKLPAKVREAADRFFGLYNLGYYRPGDGSSAGKLRIKVDRGGADVEVSETPRRPWPSRAVTLDLLVGRPEVGGSAGYHSLPVVFEFNLSDLPLRRGGGVHGCQMGMYLQAAKPDGTIVGEAFREVTVARDEGPKQQDPTMRVRQLLRVELPPGPYRLRARASDDRQEIVSQRIVDLTILPTGEVRGGLAP